MTGTLGADVVMSRLGSLPWLPLLCFAAGVLVLEFFDISLPRGDTLGVSGALNVAAIMLLPSAVSAILASSIGTLLAFAARRTTDRHTHPAVEIPSLSAAFAAGLFVHEVTPAFRPGSLGYYAGALILCLVYLAVELVAVQFLVAKSKSRSILRLIYGNLVRQAPLLAAQVSASILAVIIYPYMGVWGLLLVVVLLLLIRQSYSMLLDVRETYRTTIEVLVEAAEGPDGRRHGHSERTAEIARAVGSFCGLSPTEVEQVSYAALLHDVDAIGNEPGGRRDGLVPSQVLHGVRSFEAVARVLKVLEGECGLNPTESELLAAYVVALANDIDCASNGELKVLHGVPAVDRLGHMVPREAKARAVSAALRLGYRVPAVS